MFINCFDISFLVFNNNYTERGGYRLYKRVVISQGHIV